MPTKTREKKAGADKVNALRKPVQPSDELAAIIGSAPLPRAQVVSKIWDYIRSHNLQNSENRREILADDKLRKVFGKDKVTMFEMNNARRWPSRLVSGANRVPSWRAGLLPVDADSSLLRPKGKSSPKLHYAGVSPLYLIMSCIKMQKIPATGKC
jgi:upstream activation factor subunit UAF30